MQELSSGQNDYGRHSKILCSSNCLTKCQAPSKGTNELSMYSRLNSFYGLIPDMHVGGCGIDMNNRFTVLIHIIHVLNKLFADWSGIV